MTMRHFSRSFLGVALSAIVLLAACGGSNIQRPTAAASQPQLGLQPFSSPLSPTGNPHFYARVADTLFSDDVYMPFAQLVLLPSFGHESAVFINRRPENAYELVHIRVERVSSEQGDSGATRVVSVKPIDDAAARSVMAVWRCALQQVKPPPRRSRGAARVMSASVDGTSYLFGALGEGQYLGAKAHEPSPDTIAAQLVDIGRLMIEFTNSSSRSESKNRAGLLEKSKALLRYWPEGSPCAEVRLP